MTTSGQPLTFPTSFSRAAPHKQALAHLFCRGTSRVTRVTRVTSLMSHTEAVNLHSDVSGEWSGGEQIKLSQYLASYSGDQYLKDQKGTVVEHLSPRNETFCCLASTVTSVWM